MGFLSAPSRGSALAWPFGAATNFAPLVEMLGGWQGIGHETIVVIDPHFGSRSIKLENHPKKTITYYIYLVSSRRFF